MATLYVDPQNGNNTPPYDDWAKAATALQTAVNLAVANDVVYCRGTESISVAVVIDTNTGTIADPITFVGCNASGVEDGTRYVVDAGANAIHGFAINGIDHTRWRNFELTSSATGSVDGINFAPVISEYMVMENVYIHGWPRHGINSTAYLRYATFVRCRFSNNGSDGIYRLGTESQLTECVLNNNAVDGIDQANGVNMQSCIIRDNTAYGAKLYGQSKVVNCIAHNNGLAGFYTGYRYMGLVGCRSTNNGTYGFQATSNGRGWLLGCYAQGNGTAPTDGSMDLLTVDGDATYNEMNGSDADFGYVDSANDDFNLATGATLRSKAVALPGTSGAPIPT